MANNNIDPKSYILSLENKEYELTMTLFESVIEFKLVPKFASDYFYTEKFDLSTINERKYLLKDNLNDLKEAFKRFDTLLNNKMAKLIKEREDTIILNFHINIVFVELEKNLKLKQLKINKEVGYTILSNQINEMKEKIIELEKNLNETKKEIKEKIDIIYEDYLKKKKDEEIKKKQEEDKQKKEELIRQEEEKKLNDNINLRNDFQSQKIDMKEFYSISNKNIRKEKNTIAVYPIIRNNERLYELACVKYGHTIVIYNILLNKKTNEIYNTHCVKSQNSYDTYKYYNYSINTLRHYYYSSKKKHFLLSSNDIEIKLWNISSEIITNELKITAENHIKFDEKNNKNKLEYYYTFKCSCLLFNEDNYIIYGGTYSKSDSKKEYKIKSFNENFKGNIEKSKLKGANYMEAAYVGDKSYVLYTVMQNHMIITVIN